MKTTCKLLSLLMIVVLALTAAACSGGSQSSGESAASVVKDAATDPPETEKVEETLIHESGTGRKTLVVYFSATGSTKRIAETIASITGGDTYEIIPEQPYSEEDLDYNDENSRASLEQNDDSARPAISSQTISLDEYRCIYLGYPIWFDQAPRIINTFLETYDVSAKTIIPFCTSNSSSIDNSVAALSESYTCKHWFKGTRFGDDSTEEDVQRMINGSNL